MFYFQKMFNLRIKTKLLILLLWVALVPLIIFGTFNYVSVASRIKSEALTKLREYANHEVLQISTYFSERMKDVEVISRLPVVTEIMKECIANFQNLNHIIGKDHQFNPKLYPVLSTLKEGYGFDNLYLISLNGDMVYSVHPEADLGNNILTGPYKDSPLSHVFQDLMNYSDIKVSEFKYYEPSEKSVAFITAPIYSNNRFAGVLAVQIGTKEIDNIVQNYSGLGETGEVVLATRDGDEMVFVIPLKYDSLAAFNRRIPLGSKEALPMQEAVQGINGSGLTIDYRGEEIVAVWRYLPYVSWGLVVKMDTQEAFASIETLKDRTLLVGLFTLLIVVLIALMVSKTVSDPIVSLTRVTELVAGGDFSPTIDIDTGDEIGSLAASLRKMKNDLQKAFLLRDEEIAERKEAEERLKLSEEKLLSVVENAPSIILMVDRKGIIQYINHTVQGLTKEEVIGTKVFTYIDPAYRELAEEAHQRAFETGEPGGYEWVSINPQTKPIWFSTIIGPVKRDGTVIALTLISLDITEKVEAEKAMKESEEKFRGVIEQSNDGIYVLQHDRFVFINPRFTEITGYVLDEISQQGFDFRKLVAEEGLKVLEERETKRKKGEKLQNRYIFKARRKDGQERDLEASVTTVEWGGELATLGVIHDVTNRIQTRTQLERALEKAQEGERVKSLFLANMSHEIRTPLNAILGFTELIENSTRDMVGPEEKEFFNTIQRSGERLMRTVHEILDISQIEAGSYHLKREKIDLVNLVSDLVDVQQPMAEKKNLKLTYVSDLTSACIHADQHGVTQAINNIINNAVKYTEKGHIKITLKEKPGYWVLSIQDTGIGISKEYLDHMFDVFTQESEGYTKKFQGIGLGMAIAKHHLDLNQIKIQVNSQKNVGTTVLLLFEPSKGNSPGKDKKRKKTKNITKGLGENKKPILVVEDDPSSQRLVKFFLKKHYQLFFADSVIKAKMQLKEHQIDLVLLDLSLIGNEDGLDLVRWMRTLKKWNKIPVIATTAHAFTTDKDNCLNAGCNDYISKPIQQTKLMEKISHFI